MPQAKSPLDVANGVAGDAGSMPDVLRLRDRRRRP
jgi:hypothetical protein